MSDTMTTPAVSDLMLIDRYLPAYDFTIVEHTIVEADVPTTWSALLDTDLMQVHTPLMDAAFWIRGLPARFDAWRGRTPPPQPPPPSLKPGGDEQLEGWIGLGQAAHKEVAFGAVGRFWEPNITWKPITGTDDFLEVEAGWGRIAANFSLRPYGEDRTLLTYEARTATPDADSRRLFGRYWTLVRPFVGHIMKATLAEVRTTAERHSRSLAVS